MPLKGTTEGDYCRVVEMFNNLLWIVSKGSIALIQIRINLCLLWAAWCMASIRGWHLFEGGVYSRVASIWERCLFEGGIYLRAASIRGWHLFEGGVYSRVASIQGWCLFEGGVYSRVASIRGWYQSFCKYKMVLIYKHSSWGCFTLRHQHLS